MSLEKIINGFRKVKNSLKKTACVGLATLVLGVAAEAGTYSGGSGEPNDPFLIATPTDMNDIGANPDDWDKHFQLVADIDMSGYTGDEFNIIGTYWDNAFSGVFDGNDHTISNFTYYTNSVYHHTGLFGVVMGNNAVIKDLTLIDPNVSGTEYVGVLVGCLYETVSGCGVKGGTVTGDTPVGGLVGLNVGMILNSYADTNVEGKKAIGGLVGGNAGVGTIIDSFAEGSVKGNGYTGGLVGDAGWADGGYIISHCYATGSVDGNDYTGGLVGRNTNIVMNCYATGDVSGKDNVGGLIGLNGAHPIIQSFAAGDVTGESRVGGLVGRNEHSISDSYATGDVFGDTDVGGLIGLCSNYRAHIISHCYSISRVDGNGNTGGLVGSDWRHPYDNCFWDSDVNPDLNDVGNYGVTNGVEGKPTVEMKMEDTFTGWDFVGIWDIGENQTYPFLRIYRAGDLNHDEIVNMYDFAVIAEQWLEAK